MPELPEVEYARRALERWLRGATIVDAKAFDRAVMRPRAPSTFGHALRGRRVLSVERLGKWMRVDLDDDIYLYSHLGMTGEWQRTDANAPTLRWERARIDIERRGKRASVRYVDPRKFGRLLVGKGDLPQWSQLGPDPLSHGIDARKLRDALARRRRRSIKEVLMDQSVLAGVGNIQATEALWKARVDPRTPAGALDAKAVGAIVRGLHWTIERTLADLARGADGKDDPFEIYGHQGEPCPRCKTRLVRIILGGRSTTFCPGCQRSVTIA